MDLAWKEPRHWGSMMGVCVCTPLYLARSRSTMTSLCRSFPVTLRGMRIPAFSTFHMFWPNVSLFRRVSPICPLLPVLPMPPPGAGWGPGGGGNPGWWGGERRGRAPQEEAGENSETCEKCGKTQKRDSSAKRNVQKKSVFLFFEFSHLLGRMHCTFCVFSHVFLFSRFPWPLLGLDGTMGPPNPMWGVGGRGAGGGRGKQRKV